MSRPVAATIAAKSWIASARVLARSFRERHPEIPFFVLLADEIEGRFDPAAEPFELVRLVDLRLPAPERFRFRHAQQELTYAATPFLLDHLLDLGFDRVLFFKQESLVVGDQGPWFDRLGERSILLTPHLLQPLAGAGALERELAVLLSGVYNVGLLGVAATPTARRFLSWWGARAGAHGLHAVAEGQHFEQRWLDLVPAYFEGVEVVRDPGANVGHWNLPERCVELRGEAWFVDGRPLRLFRFSGYDPERPLEVTRHSRRLTVPALGPAAAIFERYRRALDSAGWAETRHWPYAYGRFDDGVEIPQVAREVLRELGDGAARFGDPFATGGASSFRDFLEEPVDAPAEPRRRITRLWDAIYRRRPDVRQAFPDLPGADRDAFLAWTASSGLAEHGVPERLLGHRVE
jgi:hypothetical protein